MLKPLLTTTPVTVPGAICTLLFVFCLPFVFSIRRRHRRVAGHPLPPGPTGLPLIGNVLEIDTTNPWLTYEKWGKQYGSVVYVNMLGKDFIIITSAQVAHDLMDRRSAIYSDRPYLVANAMFGIDFGTGILPYGNKLRLHRKLFNIAIGREAARRYKPVALSKARQLIENMLDQPKDYARHCKTFATAAIMAVLYGYQVAPRNDPFVTKIEHFLESFLTALTPEKAALLLAFPFLAHIPTWLPGGEFQLRAAKCRALAEEVLTGPVRYVKDSMAAGTAPESLVRGLLEEEDGKVDEDIIKAVATSAFLAGAETSDSTLQVFFLAMVLYPEVQVKAWEEIDRVVGSGRLPEFDDRPKLPYAEAVCLETSRWFPVVPDGLPRMTADDDVYQGMYIPKGAIVLTSIWAMGHDETRFDDPMAFRPERHLTPEGALAEGVTNDSFGFGRRACPGKHLADQNIWAAVVTSLATLRIEKARDGFGNEIEVKMQFTSGVTTAPKPFACSITPRSPYAEGLIRLRKETGL